VGIKKRKRLIINGLVERSEGPKIGKKSMSFCPYIYDLHFTMYKVNERQYKPSSLKARGGLHIVKYGRLEHRLN
jgi:hypothetical protein